MMRKKSMHKYVYKTSKSSCVYTERIGIEGRIDAKCINYTVS